MDTIAIFSAKYLLFANVFIAGAVAKMVPREQLKHYAAFALSTLGIAFVISRIAGHFYFDPRPFVIGNFTPLISHVVDNGFPSDHTLAAAALAVAVFPFSKKATGAAIAIALAVGAARVYVGVHHWIDIVGSVGIAIAAGLAAHAAIAAYKRFR